MNVPVAFMSEELKPDASMTFSLRMNTEICTVKAAPDEPSREAETTQVPELFMDTVPRSIAEKEMRVGALRRERKYGAAVAFKETTVFDKTVL